MRFRHLFLALALAFSACSTSPTATSTPDVVVSLVPDFANSSATAIDAAGIGAAQFPDSLKLTTEQKAAIEALHAAFTTANAADIAALQALEAQARAAMQSGRGAGDIRAILAQGAPILVRMNAAFAALQAAILQVYTPAERAWISAHQPRPCGPNGPPHLTDAQVQQMHALQEAFTHAVRDDVALIRATADSAHRAAEAGATHDAVNAILHQADAAQARVHAAELKLQQDLEAVLTAEQRAAHCGVPPSAPIPHP
jgi:Spy/CpxP family protein refolding chaperone